MIVEMKMLAIFSSFDKDNIIDDYVVYYLKELSKFADIIFVADNYISKFQLDKIREYTIKAIAYSHGEYDFGGYKTGYIYAKENKYIQEHLQSHFLIIPQNIFLSHRYFTFILIIKNKNVNVIS